MSDKRIREGVEAWRLLTPVEKEELIRGALKFMPEGEAKEQRISELMAGELLDVAVAGLEADGLAEIEGGQVKERKKQ